MNYELDFFIPRMHRGRHHSTLLARMDICMWVGIIWNIHSLVKISLNNFTNMNNTGPSFLFWFFDEHLSLLTRHIPSSSDLRHNHFWCTWTLSVLSPIKKKGNKHSALKEHFLKRYTNHNAFQYTVTNLKYTVINDYGGTLNLASRFSHHYCLTLFLTSVWFGVSDVAVPVGQRR